MRPVYIVLTKQTMEYLSKHNKLSSTGNTNVIRYAMNFPTTWQSGPMYQSNWFSYLIRIPCTCTASCIEKCTWALGGGGGREGELTAGAVPGMEKYTYIVHTSTIINPLWHYLMSSFPKLFSISNQKQSENYTKLIMYFH